MAELSEQLRDRGRLVPADERVHARGALAGQLLEAARLAEDAEQDACVRACAARSLRARQRPAPRRARAVRGASRHEPELALRCRQPLDAVGRDEDVLLEPDVATAGNRRPVLEREDVALLDEAERRRPVAIPARCERRAAVVRRAPELMAERVHRLRIAGSDEARARGRVDLPAGGARPERGDAGVHRRPERIPRTANVVRRGRLALVEEVPDALQVAAVVGARDAEVDVQELAAPGAQLARRAVADVLLRPGVDGRAVVASPGVAEAAPFDLRVHERRRSRARSGPGRSAP